MVNVEYGTKELQGIEVSEGITYAELAERLSAAHDLELPSSASYFADSQAVNGEDTVLSSVRKVEIRAAAGVKGTQ